MYLSKTRLPHVLPPAAYYSAEHYSRERATVLEPAWHAVGTLDELGRTGAFITRDLFGHAVHVRNFDGEVRALSNVCAHRHCLISSAPGGRSETMRCQYHGWEYGPDGKTRRIPSPKNFAPFNGAERIPTYRVATCGRIVFVCISEQAPDLREFLGDYFEVIEARFGDQMKEFLRLDLTYATNWKVPIENSLESYHVPAVHPKTFGEDPGDERSTHVLRDGATAFGTSLPFSPHSRVDSYFQRVEGTVVRMMGGSFGSEYWQHHLFPSLLMSFTDAVSLLHSVTPTGPTTATATIRQFGFVGSGRRGPRRWLGVSWGRLKGAITRAIITEDIRVLSAIQGGLERSSEKGVLGRCEERIHAFQAFVADRTST